METMSQIKRKEEKEDECTHIDALRWDGVQWVCERCGAELPSCPHCGKQMDDVQPVCPRCKKRRDTREVDEGAPSEPGERVDTMFKPINYDPRYFPELELVVFIGEVDGLLAYHRIIAVDREIYMNEGAFELLAGVALNPKEWTSEKGDID